MSEEAREQGLWQFAWKGKKKNLPESVGES